jgi:hypothetical protein
VSRTRVALAQTVQLAISSLRGYTGAAPLNRKTGSWFAVLAAEGRSLVSPCCPLGGAGQHR